MSECKDCKRRREHFSAVLPFSIAEKIVDKPCKIRGIAMTAGIKNAEGVNFNIPRKSEMASLFKQRMMSQRLFYPYLTWEKPYRGDICSELNVERYELRKDGAINLSHPNGTHDDCWWSIALAVYGTVEMKAFDLEALKFG